MRPLDRSRHGGPVVEPVAGGPGLREPTSGVRVSIARGPMQPAAVENVVRTYWSVLRTERPEVKGLSGGGIELGEVERPSAPSAVAAGGQVDVDALPDETESILERGGVR